MFGILMRTTRFFIGKSSRRLGFVLGAGIALGMASFAHGQILYTTTSDFSGWTINSPGTGATASTAFDYDGGTTNGLGNNVPGTSTGGSLYVSASSMGYSELAFAPNVAYNDAFMHAIDPGSTTAYSAASGYGPGSTVAYSGTLYMVFTAPTLSAGAYYQLGLNLDYPADGYYDAFVDNGTSDGTVDGLSTYTETIPYTITAGSGNLTNFQMAIQTNSNSSAATSFYIDDISLSVPVPVPEPATLGALAMGLTLLTLRRRVVV